MVRPRVEFARRGRRPVPVKDPVSEAISEVWAVARSYVPSIEAGARALRREQARRLARFEPAAAGLLGDEAKNLERLADWLDKGGRL